jgi:hypothetical protein
MEDDKNLAEKYAAELKATGGLPPADRESDSWVDPEPIRTASDDHVIQPAPDPEPEEEYIQIREPPETDTRILERFTKIENQLHRLGVTMENTADEIELRIRYESGSITVGAGSAAIVISQLRKLGVEISDINLSR